MSLLVTETLSADRLPELAASGTLFMIVDACGEPDVVAKAEEVGESRAASLYRGIAEEDYAAFAPYLFHVDAELLEWIVQGYWDKPWGILVSAELPLEAVRKHFRRFLIVQDPDGREMYFRFYDPRVLPIFLPTCNAEELAALFGPSQGLGITCEGSQDVVLYRLGPGVSWSAQPMAEAEPEPEPASSTTQTPTRKWVR